MDSSSLKPRVQYSLFTHILVYLMWNAFGVWLLCYISFPISQFWVSLYGKPEAFPTKASKLLTL